MAYPYLELSEHIERLSKDLGYSTFDYLPKSGTPYPFVFVGEMFTDDLKTATKVMAEANVILHIFNYEEDMKETKLMAFNLSKAIHENSNSGSFEWNVINQKGTFMFEVDDPEDTIIAHAVIDLTLKNN
ncbi:MAG: hypothetical protein ACTH54_03305 [Vagococcus salmoninarum]|uniref:hypothetical protein n=1 Tax=Vagococcus salmoninarum TaxID=2739 RepID=UPI003F978888